MGLLGINPFTYAPNKTTYEPPTNDTDLKLDREKHGRCANCGLQTHEERHSLFFIGSALVPLTNDTVLRGRCLVCNPINTGGPNSMSLGFSGVKVHDDPLVVEDADDPIPLSTGPTEFMQPTSFTGVSIRMPESSCIVSNTSRSETAHPVSNKHSTGKALCACVFAVACAAAGSGVGVYFYLQDPDTTSTTTSTQWVTSTATTPSPEDAVSKVTTQANVQVETSQATTDTTTQYITDPTATKPSSEQLRDISAIEQDVEASVICRGVKFSTLSDTDSRNLALDWLLHDDEMQLDVSDSNLYQRYTLALLAFGFGSNFQSSVGWLSANDECGWYGVTCDSRGEVIKLELSAKHLTGTLPPEISRLQYLEELLLYQNYLSGTLASELGLLSRLTDLQLHTNELIGTIPPELGDLTSLSYLSLNENLLTGPIPPELGNLRDLTELWLYKNQFTGTLPSQLGSLTSLTGLWIYTNQLTGSIPTELGLLTSLNDLEINGNKFSGNVPSELGKLKDYR